jgi:hypothetical protein
VALMAVLVGVFGVYAGWHWKILHRAMRDVNRYKSSVRGAKKAERDSWGRAIMFGVAAVLILIVLAHM